MRLINYLVFVFLTLLSFSTFADVECSSSFGSSKGVASSIDGSCAALGASVNKVNSNWSYDKSVAKTETYGECYLKNPAGGGTSTVPVSCTKVCPTKNTMNVHWMSKSTTSIPLRMCVEGCTYEGSGLVTETQNYKNTVLFATGDNKNCSNLNSDTNVVPLIRPLNSVL